ncbi:hypothetical protein, partial [Paraeggerthella hongkongensis]|uniref:hypothetical protein n=1 Tax=Paraeggerthella hongkongensis TaxID=230658 RepID=UPI001B8611CE
VCVHESQQVVGELANGERSAPSRRCADRWRLGESWAQIGTYDSFGRAFNFPGIDFDRTIKTLSE